ncbi:Movement protein TGB2 [Frankliniella fusca]|uniref:Movement protein TGB2 n=1 Tax=Frankliniella fusca TaxID=407009 RepID=A0AAE1H7S9_9NEOP|nr:Movement protein TGB2 [Frankliniella fusca]
MASRDKNQPIIYFEGQERGPGPTGALPSIQTLKAIEIEVKNPKVDGASSSTQPTSIEDLKIPRRPGKISATTYQEFNRKRLSRGQSFAPLKASKDYWAARS